MNKYMEQWSEFYRSVSIVVNRWDCPGSGKIWNYYLYLNEKIFPDNTFEEVWLEAQDDPFQPGRPTYDYMYSDLFSDMEFHGGVTYYQKISGFDGDVRSVKVGCDYNHLHDQYNLYSLERVANDARRTVDKLRELRPKLLFFNRLTGELLEEEPNK